jgi:histidinol-phosphate/aromatic aminotransferase/cobyric acid decarboxylase-like protein
MNGLAPFEKFSQECAADPNQDKTRKAVAAAHGVTPEQVVCGAGSDDILEIIIRAFSLSAVIVASPTFSMYAFLVSRITFSARSLTHSSLRRG